MTFGAYPHPIPRGRRRRSSAGFPCGRQTASRPGNRRHRNTDWKVRLAGTHCITRGHVTMESRTQAIATRLRSMDENERFDRHSWCPSPRMPAFPATGCSAARHRRSVGQKWRCSGNRQRAAKVQQATIQRGGRLRFSTTRPRDFFDARDRFGGRRRELFDTRRKANVALYERFARCRGIFDSVRVVGGIMVNRRSQSNAPHNRGCSTQNRA